MKMLFSETILLPAKQNNEMTKSNMRIWGRESSIVRSAIVWVLHENLKNTINYKISPHLKIIECVKFAHDFLWMTRTQFISCSCHSKCHPAFRLSANDSTCTNSFWAITLYFHFSMSLQKKRMKNFLRCEQKKKEYATRWNRVYDVYLL